MRAAERDVLLMALAAGSGSADGWSYFGLGHAFVANVTGNTVLLGISVFHGTGNALHQMIALAGYVLGTAVGTTLNGNIHPGSVWARPVSRSLFLEGILLLLAEIAWISAHGHPAPALQAEMLGTTAVAIGIQSGAMMQLKIPGIVTTYITGTWTTLVNGLTLLARRQRRIVRNEKSFEERFALQAAVLASYFLSAVLTGWAFRYAPRTVGIVPALAVLAVCAYGVLRD